MSTMENTEITEGFAAVGEAFGISNAHALMAGR